MLITTRESCGLKTGTHTTLKELNVNNHKRILWIENGNSTTLKELNNNISIDDDINGFNSILSGLLGCH